MIKSGETCTVIGRTAKLRGDLLCADDLQIEGDLEGTLRVTSGRLTIGAEATVRGNIYAPEVVISGKVVGDVRAVGRVDLRSSAVVLGDVFAGRISMEENAVLRGYVNPERAGEEEPLPNTSVRLHIVGTDEPQTSPTPMDEGELDPAPLTSSEPPAAVEREQVVPQPVLRQSGRQLPTALAAFATGGRQDTALEVGAYGKEGALSDEDLLWRDSVPEE